MTLALLFTAVTGAWASGEIVVTVTAADLQADKSTTFTKDGVTIKCWDRMQEGLAFSELYEMSTTLGYFTKIEITNQHPEGISGINGISGFTVNGSVATWTGKASSVGLGHYSVGPVVQFVFTIEPAEPAIDVTINDDKTEATMESMPTYDVNFNYELVRDMSVSMTTEIGDGKDGYRIRLQKNEQTGKYEPAEMTAQQMKELVKVHDALENYDLTFGVLGANCIVNIYAANDENQAVGEPIAFADLTPGRYIAKAVAATGSAYEGETDMSNIFELFEGYEVEIAAGEFVTYYKDEALKVEDENAQLYTITAVSGTTATATELTVAAANTPLLVKNNAAEKKTILLIPTSATPDNVEVYSGFKGTLEGTQIAGSTDTQANYVCTGKQFTWVKDAGTIAANRCWLELVSSTGAPVLDIVFDGNATGIETTKFTDDANDAWYDLNGRRLQAKPTTKGVYILNGRKVVVK